jgi:hypothetical protein
MALQRKYIMPRVSINLRIQRKDVYDSEVELFVTAVARVRPPQISTILATFQSILLA